MNAFNLFLVIMTILGIASAIFRPGKTIVTYAVLFAAFAGIATFAPRDTDIYIPALYGFGLVMLCGLVGFFARCTAHNLLRKKRGDDPKK